MLMFRRTLSLAICLLPLIVSGCSGSDAVPTSTTAKTSSGSSSSSGTATHDGVSTLAAWTVHGQAEGCASAAEAAALPNQELIWNLVVRDAGDKGISRFRTFAYFSDEPGCEPTLENLRTDPYNRIRQAGGPASYPSHGADVTLFSAPVTARGDGLRCGRSQFDILMDDGTASGTEFVRLLVNFEVRCPPKTPPPPAGECAPTHAIMSSPVTWAYYPIEERLAATFTVSPALTSPVRLAFASYALVPGAVSPYPGAPPLPQRLVYHNAGIYQPGQTSTVTLVVPGGRATVQADVLSCDEPTEDLTAANFAYWNARTIAWWPPEVAGR